VLILCFNVWHPRFWRQTKPVSIGFEVLTAVVTKDSISVVRWKSSFTCCLIHAGFSLGLFFDPEDGGDILSRDGGWLAADYMCVISQTTVLSANHFLEENKLNPIDLCRKLLKCIVTRSNARQFISVAVCSTEMSARLVSIRRVERELKCILHYFRFCNSWKRELLEFALLGNVNFAEHDIRVLGIKCMEWKPSGGEVVFVRIVLYIYPKLLNV
jgi:hypothetical protein